jgi:hypothetical protein
MKTASAQVGTVPRLAFGVWRLAFGVARSKHIDPVSSSRAVAPRPREKADPIPRAAETFCRCPKRAMNGGVPIRGRERFPNRERRAPNAKRRTPNAEMSYAQDS